MRGARSRPSARSTTGTSGRRYVQTKSSHKRFRTPGGAMPVENDVTAAKPGEPEDDGLVTAASVPAVDPRHLAWSGRLCRRRWAAVRFSPVLTGHFEPVACLGHPAGIIR